jgi:hypothetical protein
VWSSVLYSWGDQLDFRQRLPLLRLRFFVVFFIFSNWMPGL